jgi:hypothetical protein
MSTDQAEQPIACYRGTVRVHWRIRNHYMKGTLGGEMAVHTDHLLFRGVGVHRLELRDYTIARTDISGIYPSETIEIPRLLRLLPIRRYGIRIISNPDGTFRERDEYSIRFDTPNLDEVLASLRAIGYPIGGSSPGT